MARMASVAPCAFRALRPGAAGLFALLAFGLVPGRAEACGAWPCAEVRATSPSDGATGVPTNAELRILRFGLLTRPLEDSEACSEAFRTLRLVGPGDEVTELLGTQKAQGSFEEWLVTDVPTGLAPNTTYSVEVPDWVSECGCPVGQAWVRATTFTTGAANDAAPPVFDEEPHWSISNRIDQHNACGSMDGFRATLDAPVSAPGDGIVLEVESAGAFVGWFPPAEATLWLTCGAEDSAGATLVPGAEVTVRARDLAGNVSAASTPFALLADCAGDSGKDEVTNGNDEPIRENTLPTNTGGSEAADAGAASGCSVTRSPRPNGVMWIPFLCGALAASGARRVRGIRQAPK